MVDFVLPHCQQVHVSARAAVQKLHTLGVLHGPPLAGPLPRLEGGRQFVGAELEGGFLDFEVEADAAVEEDEEAAVGVVALLDRHNSGYFVVFGDVVAEDLVVAAAREQLDLAGLAGQPQPALLHLPAAKQLRVAVNTAALQALVLAVAIDQREKQSPLFVVNQPANPSRSFVHTSQLACHYFGIVSYFFHET